MAISKIKVGSTEHELQTTIGNVTDLQNVLNEKLENYVITLWLENTQVVEVNKTFNEIRIAWENGYRVLLRVINDGSVYIIPIVEINDSIIRFSSVFTNITAILSVTSSNDWSYSEINIDSKQDKLTGTEGQMVGFDANGNAVAQYLDSTPTSGSTNPVSSGGVYTALDAKQSKITGTEGQTVEFDSAGNLVAVDKEAASSTIIRVW